MSETQKIRVEVAYARPERQLILAVELAPGATVEQAINASGILTQYPDIDLGIAKTGVFGKARPLSAVITDGERVEIYRPLIADPKEARRKKAEAAKKGHDTQ